jgi:hypothetical protein
MLDTAMPTLPRRMARRLSDWSASVSGFKNDNDAGWFGFVRPQTRKGLIAPAGKADNFTSWKVFVRHFGRLQNVEAATIEKERMIPKQVVQLPDCGVVVGKDLGMELAQSSVYLCRVQLHVLLLFCPSADLRVLFTWT